MIVYVLTLIAIFVLILIASIYIFVSNFFLNTIVSPSETLWGIFGDTLGGTLNPILTFISFLAILYTIYLQGKELSETRKELARTAETQEIQKFENLFFKLIDTHELVARDLLSATIEVNEPINDDTGEFMIVSRNYIEHQYKNIFKSKFADIESARKRLHSKNNIHGRYYIFLYNILKNNFIQNNRLTEEVLSNPHLFNEKIKTTKANSKEKSYANIIRSLIDKKLLSLLAVNCAVDSKDTNYYTYKLLIQRYCFFEHFEGEINALIKPSKVELGLKKYYDKSHFGKNNYFQKLLQIK